MATDKNIKVICRVERLCNNKMINDRKNVTYNGEIKFTVKYLSKFKRVKLFILHQKFKIFLYKTRLLFHKKVFLSLNIKNKKCNGIIRIPRI